MTYYTHVGLTYGHFMYYYLMYCVTTSCSVAMLAVYIKSPEFVLSALVSRASCIDKTTTVAIKPASFCFSVRVLRRLILPRWEHFVAEYLL